MLVEEVLRSPVDRKQNRGFILGSLAFGHGIAHLYDQGLPVFMPAITRALSLSSLQVATLLGIRQAGFGGVNLGAGVVRAAGPLTPGASGAVQAGQSG